MCYEFWSGNLDRARELQLKSIPLINALFSEVNPIPVKACLNMMGYNFGKPRLPLIEMTSAGKENLKNALDEFNKK